MTSEVKQVLYKAFPKLPTSVCYLVACGVYSIYLLDEDEEKPYLLTTGNDNFKLYLLDHDGTYFDTSRDMSTFELKQYVHLEYPEGYGVPPIKIFNE